MLQLQTERETHNNIYSVSNLLLLALLVFSKCTFLFVFSASLGIDTDKEALIAFRSQISLESPNPLSSWEQNLSPCNWTGVSCNRFGQRVVGLNLSGMRLVGSISPFIGNLSFLRSLQLQNNQLTGTIPDQITNLFRLQVLNMSFNSLRGSIPMNISKLVERRVLDLTMNRITGKLPDELSVLAGLQDLHLARNLFTGEIPPLLANISSLVTLNLGTNSLTGRIPSDLSRLQNLTVLDLTINSLAGTVPASIYNMSSLVSLALASNFLSGTIPSDVGDTLPNLLVFNFCFNNFTGTIPRSLHNLTNIEVIRMAHNLLEGTVPPGLGNLPFLTMYNIGYNKIVSSGEEGLGFLTLLTNSTRLNFLAIDGNRLEGLIPDSVGNLSKVLQKLYMGGNQIHGHIPNSIGQLSSLTLLDLDYNAIDGLIPPAIGLLKDLQVLVLARNRLSGIIPDSLGNLQKLNRIDLSGNELVGQIPMNLENLKSLLSMDLSNNRLNGSIPKEIISLRSLTTILNLSNNFLTGNLPQEIGNLENIVAIDFSNNSLQGAIPSSIRDCKSLEELYLAWNGFSGSIPGTLAEVKALKTLDLSHNRLSGPIPPELQNLQVLQSLNLSFNDLEGLIPREGVFRNQSNARLEGNPKLCLACGQKSQSRRNGLIKVSISVSAMALLALCFSVGFVFYLRKRRTKTGAKSDSLNSQYQIVPYNELRQATQDFNPENLIGSGSFGSVYKGYNVKDHSVVAVKVLDTKNTGSWKSFLAECEALKNTRHRNLVKLITSCSSIDFKNNEFLALVYEFLGNGSLDDWLRGKRKKENGEGLNLVERINVAIDVASVLDYLHHDSEVPVIHCDLKPSNVLLDDDMTAKVGDFGLARLLVDKISDLQASISSTHVLKGSIGYIPPEYGLGVKPSTAGDTYSFGVMLLELLTGKSPCNDSFLGEQNLAVWVQSAFCTNVLQVVDPELLQLINNHCQINPEIQDCLIKTMEVGLSCTVGNPSSRISIRDALYKLKAIKKKLPGSAPGEKTKHLSRAISSL